MEENKRKLVRSWLKKALHDLAAARALSEHDRAILDVAIYHCQQAAEKALKGYLLFWDVQPGKTHDVGLLLERAAEVEAGFGSWEDAANRLTPYATFYRYPGEIDEPDCEQIEEAIDDAATIVNQVLAFLPDAVHPDREPNNGSGTEAPNE
jgi:HEPN domain-containing protein